MSLRHLLFAATAAAALTACGAPASSGTPVPCTSASDCPDGFVCDALETDDGPTNTICLDETDCGELTCASGRCALEPDLQPAEVQCIAES